jgi:hypothetical protein
MEQAIIRERGYDMQEAEFPARFATEYYDPVNSRCFSTSRIY